MTQTVQNSIGYIASLCERVKNLFNFTIPYLSYLAILLTIAGAIVLYFIPVRYLILAWGVNKFSRKILRPHSVPNNELLDLISRVPDDEELLNYRWVINVHTVSACISSSVEINRIFSLIDVKHLWTCFGKLQCNMVLDFDILSFIKYIINSNWTV